MTIQLRTIDNTKKIHWKINPFYNSFWVNKFINKFIKNGKKAIVEQAVNKAFSEIKQKLKYNPSHILLKSIENLKPIIGIAKLFKYRGKRRRRKIILIPVPLFERRQVVIALSWLFKLITTQKKFRHRHRYHNIVKTSKKQRGLSKSKKKTFNDRFQATLKNQRLNTLIAAKFSEIYASNYEQLIRRKTLFYITITNNRTYSHYRWA